jgi:hypothetical protein
LKTFLTQIEPVLPLTPDPPVICFWKSIECKDYEVSKNRNLESVSAKNEFIFFLSPRAFPPAADTLGPPISCGQKKRFLVVARLSAHPQARLPSPYSQIPAPEARATTQARFPSRYCSRSTRSRRRRTPIWAPRRKLLCCPRHRPAPTHTRRCHRFGCCPRRAAIGTAAASRGHRCTHNESATFGGFAQVTIAEEGCRSDRGDAAALYDIVNAYSFKA